MDQFKVGAHIEFTEVVNKMDKAKALKTKLLPGKRGKIVEVIPLLATDEIQGKMSTDPTTRLMQNKVLSDMMAGKGLLSKVLGGLLKKGNDCYYRITLDEGGEVKSMPLLLKNKPTMKVIS